MQPDSGTASASSRTVTSERTIDILHWRDNAGRNGLILVT
jgi:hypothetical protein